MAFIHQNDIIHRDLKPKTVFLDKNFQSKMENFKSKMENFHGKMENFKSKIENFKSKMENFQSKMENFKSKIENFKNKMENFKNKIENILKKLKINDIFAKYNLANLLLDEGNYDGAVKLLAELSIQNFKFSHMLFCLAIMMKNGFVNEESIQNELLKYNLGSNNSAETIYNYFSKMSSTILPHTGFSYEIMYLNYRTNDLIYCHGHLLLKSSLNSIVNPKQEIKLNDINELFYLGFENN